MLSAPTTKAPTGNRRGGVVFSLIVGSIIRNFWGRSPIFYIWVSDFCKGRSKAWTISALINPPRVEPGETGKAFLRSDPQVFPVGNKGTDVNR